MIFKNICILVFWKKVTSALELLKPHSWHKMFFFLVREREMKLKESIIWYLSVPVASCGRVLILERPPKVNQYILDTSDDGWAKIR